VPNDDAYPSSWRPPHIKERDRAEAQRADDAAQYIGSLSDDDLDALIARIRPNTTGGPK
jgi:hypothetical protein